MFATIERSTKTQRKPSKEKKPGKIDQYQEMTEEEIFDELLEDKNFQKKLGKYQTNSGIVLPLAEEFMSVLNDIDGFNFDYAGKGNYKIKNWETQDVAYRVLRRAGSTEPARLIKNKRRLGLAQYGRIPKNDGIQRGCRLVFADPDYSPDKYEKAMIRQWDNVIFNNLFYAANDRKPNFSKFLGNCYEDWFDLDDITIEIRRNGLGEPQGIHIQDPQIVKPVIKKSRIYPNLQRLDETFLTPYLENSNNMLSGEAKFTEEEEPDYIYNYKDYTFAATTDYVTRKFHFFTRSDFRFAQRGFGIVEQAVNILTYIINSLKMNASNFNNNRMPKGLLIFTGGGIGPMQLEKFKKIMNAYASGIDPNKFPMLGLNGEKSDAKWVGIGGTSREMEYHLWITLLFSIFCQLSGTDPREISLGAHKDAIKAQSISDKSSDGEINENRDLGEKIFLNHMEDSLNAPDKDGDNLFKQITGMPVKMEFAGFELVNKKEKQEITKLELSSSKSLNDILAKDDQEKQVLMIDEEINLYDIKAPNLEVVKSVIIIK